MTTKRDWRLERFVTFFFFGCVVAAVYFYFNWSAASMFIPFGAMLAVGIGAWIWLTHFYRCRECGARLQPESRPLEMPPEKEFPLRYPCEKCQILWDTGIRTASDSTDHSE